MTTITLTSGTLDTTDNLDGWIITSPQASAEGVEDVDLKRGDRIDINGNVYRDGELIANLA